MAAALASFKPIRRMVDLGKQINTAGQTAVITLLFYLVFTVVGLALHEWNPLWFVWLQQEGGTHGYDGQYVYGWAADRFDGVIAISRLPGYRLQRIFYPIVVSIVSMGRLALIPWVMIGVNVVVIPVTTWKLATWLKEQELWVGYALMYGLYVGTFMAFSRDLTEPLAFGLIVFAAVPLFKGKWWGVIPLALALLTKEITLLFLLGFMAVYFLQQNWRGFFIVASGGIPFCGVGVVFTQPLWRFADYPGARYGTGSLYGVFASSVA